MRTTAQALVRSFFDGRKTLTCDDKCRIIVGRLSLESVGLICYDSREIEKIECLGLFLFHRTEVI